jgi:hypothetical protein
MPDAAVLTHMSRTARGRAAAAGTEGVAAVAGGSPPPHAPTSSTAARTPPDPSTRQRFVAVIKTCLPTVMIGQEGLSLAGREKFRDG